MFNDQFFRRALALLWLLSCAQASSCISLSWERKLSETPLDTERVEALALKTSTLQQCLASLGAPLHVWELADGQFALAYGWRNNRELGIGVSLPVSQDQTANFDYDEITQHTRGYVLFFDAQLRLIERRAGMLNEIAPGARRRPSFEEQT